MIDRVFARAVLTLALVSIAGISAASQPIPSLLQVPASFASPMRARLIGKRSVLSHSYDTLKTDVERFEAKCSRVAEDTTKDTQCKSEDKGLEERRADYISKGNAYNSEIRTALNDRVAALRAVVVRDQQAIRKLGIAKTIGQYDDWIELSSDAERERDEQFKEALHAAAEQVLEAASVHALEHGLDRVGSLNPPKANRLITQLRKAGVSDPHAEQLLRKIAYTPGKPDKARQAKELIRHLEQMKHLWSLEDLTDTSDSAKWKAGADILGIFIEDKRLRLVGMLTLDEVRAVFYSVNNNIVRQVALSGIESLTRLNELQLQDLKILSGKLESDVERLRQAKRERARVQ